MATGGAQILAAALHDGGSWATTPLADASVDAPAVALTSESTAIGVIRSISNAGELRATSWSGGTWSLFAAVANGVTTRAAPSITASASTANVVFHGDDFKHYFASHGAGWSPVAEPVKSGMNQSFGPSPASIATIGADAIVAFAGNNQDLYDQTRTGGAWQPAVAHGLGATVALTPAIVALTSGPALMIAYVRTTDARIVFTTRTGSVWSAPAPIDTNALSNDPVSLAALPGGAAVLAYRGQNGKIYWSRYTPGAVPPWSAPTGVTATNFDTPSPPAVAQGISGAEAEMVFVNAATGAAMHARLNGMAWSAPATIGGTGLQKVAIASRP